MQHEVAEFVGKGQAFSVGCCVGVDQHDGVVVDPLRQPVDALGGEVLFEHQAARGLHPPGQVDDRAHRHAPLGTD